MRPIETLLLLANLLTLLPLALLRPRATGGIRHAAPVALLIAAAQMLVEGPRWQMIPAYTLTALFVLIWWAQNFTPVGARSGRHGSRRLAAGVAVGLGGLGLAVSALMPIMLPVFRFPQPSGPNAIGTLTYHWVDAARAKILTANPGGRRELMVQIWYPAKADPSAQRAPYLPDAGAVTAALARMHAIPAFVFGHFKYVSTNAMRAAPAAGDQHRYPVLLFLEGASGFRQMNTFQVEELVSHGYAVAAIDQPGAAANVVFPDGRQAAGLTVAQFRATVGPSYLPSLQAPLLNGRPLPGGSLIPFLAQDVSFALDRLVAVNQADPNGILTGRLDMQRVGAFGVSLGGIVVGEACRLEPRLRACLVMDAPMPTEVVRAGLQQPSMWLTRDAATMRLERQRAGGWPEAEIQAHQTSMRAVYQGLAGDGYLVQVRGMFHSNFMDMPNWSALAAPLGLAGPINGQRAHGIVNAYSRAFFDRHLSGHPSTLLEGTAPRYPEVVFESRRP